MDQPPPDVPTSTWITGIGWGLTTILAAVMGIWGRWRKQTITLNIEEKKSDTDILRGIIKQLEESKTAALLAKEQELTNASKQHQEREEQFNNMFSEQRGYFDTKIEKMERVQAEMRAEHAKAQSEMRAEHAEAQAQMRAEHTICREQLAKANGEMAAQGRRIKFLEDLEGRKRDEAEALRLARQTRRQRSSDHEEPK